MKSTTSFQRSASKMLVLSGIITAPVGLLNLVYPPAVESTVWGYPFPSSVLIVVSVILVIGHLLKAYGFEGLARMNGASTLTRWSLRIAVLGFVIVAVCEAISATLAGVPIDSASAVNLNNAYGVGSMLLAIPSMVGGIGIIRRRLLHGFSRWSVFLSGAFMVFVVTPTLIMGRAWPAYLALTVWSFFYIWIGLAFGRTLRNERA